MDLRNSQNNFPSDTSRCRTTDHDSIYTIYGKSYVIWKLIMGRPEQNLVSRGQIAFSIFFSATTNKGLLCLKSHTMQASPIIDNIVTHYYV